MQEFSGIKTQDKTVDGAIDALETAFDGTGSEPASHAPALSGKILDIITKNLTSGLSLTDENGTYLYIADSVYTQMGLTKEQIGPGDSLEKMQSLTRRDVVQCYRQTSTKLPNGWTLSQTETVTNTTQSDKMLQRSMLLGEAGYWTFDFKTKTYSLSRSVKRLLTAGEVKRLHTDGLFALVDEDDRERFRIALRNLNQTHDRFGITLRLNLQTPIWAHTRVQLISTPEGKPESIQAFVSDVTESMRRKKELEAAKDAAVAATAAKSKFLARMSHEIRTPMNGILGMAELLSETDLSQNQKDYLEIINRSSHSLLTIINDILDLSKIEAGAMELDPTPFDLRDGIDDVMALLSVKAREAGTELIVDYPSELPRGFIGDAGRIRQIITNLVGNAIKFTPAGSVLLTVKATPAANGHWDLILKVKDTGIGIEPCRLDTIFSEFSQANGGISRRYGGTGLGLTITKHIAGLMGGDISVKSVHGRGSEFSVTISLEQDADFIAPQVSGQNLAGLKVMVIDDLDIILKILGRRMDRWGLDYSLQNDAKSALIEMIEAQKDGKPYDLVVCDNVMPGMHAPEFAKAMTANERLAGTPIVVLSSQKPKLAAPALKEIGITSFLLKPVRGSRLLSALQALADKSSAPLPSRADPLINKANSTLSDIRDALAAINPAAAVSPAPVISETATEPEPTLEIEPETVKIEPGKYTILVAEDFALNRDVVRLMLADSEYTPHFAKDGKIALEAYKAQPEIFSAILMDISMPIMDGFEASELIKAHQQNSGIEPIAIIALTGHALKDDKGLCMDTGMDDYLAKPVKQNLLLATLDKWVKNIGDVETQKSA